MRTPPFPSDAGSLSVIVPTRNEAANVNPLLQRLEQSLPVGATVLFVDDSDDDTPAIITRAMSETHRRLDVRMLHRQVGSRTGGLGGAVMEGVAHTGTTWVCVMDGDLQHPPEVVPQLWQAAVSHDADLVVASRYVTGGGNDGLGAVRTVISRASTVLAKAMFPYRLRGIHDPMSGFFLFRRRSLSAEMNPQGFKILLEIAVRHPGMIRREVPFTFEERTAGDSKGTIREGMTYLRLLADMRWNLQAAGQRAARRATQSKRSSSLEQARATS
jgi:dolichol-phosphate mannosyltransferase